MKRFFGMMPSDEITISKSYDDGNGLGIRIDAGPHGWTVTYADNSTEYQDKDQPDTDNFSAAYNVAKSHFPNLKEIEKKPQRVCCKCSECSES